MALVWRFFMDSIDALERRDRWRGLWHTVTHDIVLGLLGVILLSAIGALTALPQSPSAGSSLSVEQWTAELRPQLGEAFDVIQSLGLTNIAQNAWVRLVLIAFIVIALARLAERVARLARDRGGVLQFDDEERVRVTDRAPDFAALRAALEPLRYRVTNVGTDALHATRAPLAAALSALWHAGAIISALGLLLNVAAGWDASNELLTPGTPVTLRDSVALTLAPEQAGTNAAEVRVGASDNAQTTLNLTPGAAANAGATRVELRALAPGYRISAIGPNNAPLKLRTSNYLEPATDVKLSFGAEQRLNLAAPDAQLAVAVEQGDGPGADRVQIFSIGSASMLADQPIAPTIAVSNATFSFMPNINAVVSVQHRPGDAPMWFGLGVAMVFLALSALLPMRRMIVRHHGHWTEIYASGRDVRRDVRRMLAPQQTSSAAFGLKRPE
jgi:hypothetical protein